MFDLSTLKLNIYWTHLSFCMKMQAKVFNNLAAKSFSNEIFKTTYYILLTKMKGVSIQMNVTR